MDLIWTNMISKLLEINGMNVEKAGLSLLLYSLYSSSKDEGELYESMEKLLTSGKVTESAVLYLEYMGFITLDRLFRKLIIRNDLLKILEPEGDSVVEVIEYLNKRTGKRFSTKAQSTRKFIKARLKDGYSVEECKGVIDVMTAKWGNDKKMRFYLRPETLFNETKFQSYYALYLEYKDSSDENDWTINKA